MNINGKTPTKTVIGRIAAVYIIDEDNAPWFKLPCRFFFHGHVHFSYSVKKDEIMKVIVS